MTARLYEIAWRILPYVCFAPLGAVLVQIFGGGK